MEMMWKLNNNPTTSFRIQWQFHSRFKKTEMKFIIQYCGALIWLWNSSSHNIITWVSTVSNKTLFRLACWESQEEECQSWRIFIVFQLGPKLRWLGTNWLNHSIGNFLLLNYIKQRSAVSQQWYPHFIEVFHKKVTHCKRRSLCAKVTAAD